MSSAWEVMRAPSIYLVSFELSRSMWTRSHRVVAVTILRVNHCCLRDLEQQRWSSPRQKVAEALTDQRGSKTLNLSPCSPERSDNNVPSRPDHVQPLLKLQQPCWDADRVLLMMQTKQHGLTNLQLRANNA